MNLVGVRTYEKILRPTQNPTLAGMDPLPKGDVKDGDNLLLGFIKNKIWVDKEEEEEAADDDAKRHNLDEYLNEVERDDAFKEKYNFRFKEEAVSLGPLSGASHSNVGYTHGLSGDTLHHKYNIRSNKCTARKERKLEERKAEEERLRRLKNSMREEMEGRLRKVRYVLGESDEAAYVADGKRGGGEFHRRGGKDESNGGQVRSQEVR